jgi:hypothetical protein
MPRACRSERQPSRTERSPALTENTLPGTSQWAPCHCCGLHYLAADMVRFEYHPDDALCVACVSWLYDCSRPIVRRLYPLWRLPGRIRSWRANGSDGTNTDREAPGPPASCPAFALTGRPLAGTQPNGTDARVNFPPLIAQQRGNGR